MTAHVTVLMTQPFVAVQHAILAALSWPSSSTHTSTQVCNSSWLCPGALQLIQTAVAAAAAAAAQAPATPVAGSEGLVAQLQAAFAGVARVHQV